MTFNSKDIGKVQAIVYHFEKLRQLGLFEDCSSELSYNLGKLDGHVSYFRDKFAEEERVRREQKLKEDKELKDLTVRAVLAMQTFFPEAFPINREDVVPLKIGIEHDLYDFFEKVVLPYKITRTAIQMALHSYTTSEAYYECFMRCTHRRDLQGNVFEYILERDTKYAMKKLTQIRSAKNEPPIPNKI
ncbi:bacterial conjugation repressor protein [Rhizobium phage RHph_I46]|uniref:Bacterial conjugation repressor protein n=1 Tax=Rhizobium phage RHph_I1_9 TaxID=2509729 RepID=A0A7S5UXK3_9CAUD|nr:bacterial conjugation repressor protein [Rhizobium phage RHph_I1_9]QIG69590.1 bacterial conjugation repressor protein [Rhizobium phage RHph_I46]QIG70871.1 bacterial conjugation repressor protein [Rhizobium phage RHph_I9]QIG73458.1 bacterial conjugation repressor protein [Rhizobium phage RHph_I1_9]QIG76210.1 bacterial conjugation repressor protein [Rhizobium phage RHph_I34]